MAEIINKYETIYILDAALEEEKLAALSKKFQDLIAANGTVESVEEWGNRKLAYPIDYKTEGFYTLVKFSSAPEFPKELERIYGITDGVIRTLVIRAED
ncbi:MAG: 30S ribosomal protein S6 [Clostridia bacterium]|nr:30S ribosomal protein S6 [Clostridia bacterium]